jgi:hypothetical protein
MRKVFLLLLILSFVFGTVASAYANYDGTIGTRFTIEGSGFGTAKPKVYLQNGSQIVQAKVESYSDTSIICSWTKKISPGTYPLYVQPKGKGVAPISIGSFIIHAPNIDTVVPNNGLAGEIITVNGRFFTNKKPTVYLEDPVTLKRTKCKVNSFTMNPQTGESSLQFVVPKIGFNNHNVILKNSIAEVRLLKPEIEKTVGSEGAILEVTNSSSPIYGTKINIPSGVLDNAINITIGEPDSTPPLPQNVSLAGNTVDFQPSGTQFNNPVEITLHYDDSNISDETSLGLYYYDESDSKWKALSITNRDTVNNTITGSTTHFTDFGVIQKESTTLPFIGSNGIWLDNGLIVYPPTDSQIINGTLNNLKSHFITLIYANVGDLKNNATIISNDSNIGPNQDTRNLLSAVEYFNVANNHNFKVLAWINWQKEKDPTYNILDETIQQNIAARCKELVTSYGFDGVILDLEPIWSNDVDNTFSRDFLDLLDLIRNQIGTEKILSVAAPKYKDFFILPQEWYWSLSHFEKVTAKVDFISIMAYDYGSAVASADNYKDRITEIVDNVSVSLKSKINISISVMPVTEKHSPYENIQNAANGILDAMHNEDLRGIDLFMVNFSINTPSAGDWSTYDTLFAPQPSCTYNISPASQALSASSGSGLINVTAPSGCSWTATSNAQWITITEWEQPVGGGDGYVNYSVDPNTGTTQRTGTITVAGKTFTITQEGTAPPPTVDISGYWSGNITLNWSNGSSTSTAMSLLLSQSGNSVTGTVTTSDGTLNISNGIVNGNTFTFSIILPCTGGNQTLTLSHNVSGSTMTATNGTGNGCPSGNVVSLTGYSGTLTKQTAPPQNVNVSGYWRLKHSGNSGSDYQLSYLELVQSSNNISGSFKCWDSGIAITGTITGNNISLSFVAGGNNFQLSGTVTVNAISGTWSSSDGKSGTIIGEKVNSIDCTISSPPVFTYPQNGGTIHESEYITWTTDHQVVIYVYNDACNSEYLGHGDLVLNNQWNPINHSWTGGPPSYGGHTGLWHAKILAYEGSFPHYEWNNVCPNPPLNPSDFSVSSQWSQPLNFTVIP